MMAEKKKLEFFLLRYVPFAVRDEFVNIGLILREANHEGFADIRFTPDWKSVERVDPQADIEMLQAIVSHTRRQFENAEKRDAFIKKMEDSFSGAVQLSAMTGCLAEDPATEIEYLASLYFKNIHHPSQRVQSGRTRIWQQMRSAFEQQGVLGSLMTDLPMEKYTREGDPLELDFAYLVREELKIFQAVSLKGKLDQANYFGSRARSIAHDLGEKTGVTTFLTAVVDDDWDRSDNDARFALETLADNGVTVAVLADMPKIAERARLDLRV